MGGPRRFDLQLPEETLLALRRLAAADDRSAAATVRHLIKTEAARRGLWPAKTDARMQVVPAKAS